MGVAAADVASGYVLTAGVAGLVAGAMSMAAGEYVSVSSQADTEKADLDRERWELAANPESEHRELARIYVKRGLEPALADQVTEQLMEHDPLAAHARVGHFHLLCIFSNSIQNFGLPKTFNCSAASTRFLSIQFHFAIWSGSVSVETDLSTYLFNSFSPTS